MDNSEKSGGTLKLPHIVALYIGAVLGSGILIIPGVAAELSGPASLLSWGIMTILLLPMALTMGLLSSKYPNRGGVSYFVAKAFSQEAGALVGWFFVMAVIVGAPVLALTGAGYLCTALELNDTFRIMTAILILLVGVLANYFGIKFTGRLQIAVVLTTLAVLFVTIAGSFCKVEPNNFRPFMPNGWISLGTTSTIIFWCFIGWEAVSNMSEEFQNPKRDAVRGTIFAAVIVSIIYFFTAYVIIGTHSYGYKISDASLIFIIKNSFGVWGVIVAGFAALFICMAPAIAYIGAISRLIQALSEMGHAPKSFSYISQKYKTPLGGIYFLSFCFAILLVIFSARMISMATLLQIPSATFILTYLAGCAAGVKLLKGTRFGVAISYISLVLTAVIFLFVGWTILYPVMITFLWVCFMFFANKKNKNTCRTHS